MKLQLYKTMWGFEGDFETACAEASAAGFAGIEGPAPESSSQRAYWKKCLEQYNLHYIAEAVTGGGYVPQRDLGVEGHLDDLNAILSRSAELSPRFVTCIGGLDAWSEAESLRFFTEGMKLAERYGVQISFETHRSRSLFNPWVTRRIVEALPEIALTLDISHWCVVCERQMDSEPEAINAIVPNVMHIHARVGYDQGPQVPHPAAPEYAYALKAHQGVWEQVWDSQRRRGFGFTTMTPEFGPDGYLHTLPFTKAPVADLWEINQWMGETERFYFQRHKVKAVV
ncbi:TIM barrel protein [Sulfurimonas sp. HSL1-2]|uniref:sugar phosphate isomerase/epimerase family protein n=1 Tax=Thiomicrolovo zhangzhouensis TaxID=3131933 RepID=UPI0031F95E37